MASDDEEEDSARDRMVTNVFILFFLALLVVSGVWLANAIVDLRKNQDCALSGRRNCNPIPVPNPGAR
jgi:hypothetical protein